MQRSSVLLPEPLDPNDGNDIAVMGIERNALQHFERPEALVEVANLDRGGPGLI